MLNLDIPNVTTLSSLLAILNDRLRMIAAAIGAPTSDEDMGGYKITNLGDGSAPQDALNIRTADRRYTTTTAVAQQIQQVTKATTAVTGKATAAATGGTLILTAPGTLAIQSQVAPLVTLPAATAFQSVVALLKQAPSGGNLVLSISAAGKALGAVTVGDGKTTATVDASGWATVAKDAIVAVDVTSVGLTFPGADLTLELRY